MFGLSVISLLTGFAITTNYGHGGPARESDGKSNVIIIEILVN